MDVDGWALPYVAAAETGAASLPNYGLYTPHQLVIYLADVRCHQGRLHGVQGLNRDDELVG